MFASTILSILALAGSISAQASYSVSYDTTYDNAALSLTTVSCSDGTNGLITKYKYSTLGDVPVFPMVGGAQAIAGWNDANCGTCWAITYNGQTIRVLAVDHAADGFNLAQQAMDVLTGGQAVALGRVTATAVQVAASECGL
ncbi:hypothetical protein N0V82_005880 [Gnomoniopsis sp. IMI 355080]|nr:hypothetical protein N0V82_005880 [Gnomoniopsis sp. IMI 355080]